MPYSMTSEQKERALSLILVATCSEQGGEGPGGEGVEKSHCLRVWAMRTPGPTSDSHNHNGSRHLSVYNFIGLNRSKESSLN
ncbi:hypothetical protein J6590_036720 [Homalodisca vitripennis]|nr:hypothetical protein J6590_036720 [Homalodisca vitripennis]